MSANQPFTPPTGAFGQTHAVAASAGSPATTTVYVIQNNGKSVAVAYILWFLLGGLGAHRFYTDRIGTGITILALTLFGFVTFFMTTAVAFVWLLVDLFLIPGLVGSCNNRRVPVVTHVQQG